MALFKQKQSYLGVDIGTSSIKVVELANANGRPRLVTYGYIEQSSDIMKSDTPQAQQHVADLLKNIVKESRVTTKRAVAALPSFSVFTSIISLPQMNEKELMSAIRWEAKKFVPMPIEEMVLDYRVIKETQAETTPLPPDPTGAPRRAKSQNQRILLTAAPRALVNRYVAAFQAAGLQLVSLETEAFALERSLLGNDPSPVMVIDVGSNATNISVIVGSIPLFNRSIDVGGESFTKAIMQSLNIDRTRAEQFKRDFGVAPTEGGEQAPKALEFVIGSILNEVRYCMNLYQGNQTANKVEKIILTGGSAFLAHLPEYLTRILQMKVYIGDPWARVVYPVELKPVLVDIGPRFSVAIGLAMRDIV